MNRLTIPAFISVGAGIAVYFLSPAPSIYVSASLAVVLLWALDWASK